MQNFNSQASRTFFALENSTEPISRLENDLPTKNDVDDDDDVTIALKSKRQNPAEIFIQYSYLAAPGYVSYVFVRHHRIYIATLRWSFPTKPLTITTFPGKKGKWKFILFAHHVQYFIKDEDCTFPATSCKNRLFLTNWEDQVMLESCCILTGCHWNPNRPRRERLMSRSSSS